MAQRTGARALACYDCYIIQMCVWLCAIMYSACFGLARWCVIIAISSHVHMLSCQRAQRALAHVSGKCKSSGLSTAETIYNRITIVIGGGWRRRRRRRCVTPGGCRSYVSRRRCEAIRARCAGTRFFLVCVFARALHRRVHAINRPSAPSTGACLAGCFVLTCWITWMFFFVFPC